jgi:hypothetical protein
MKKETRINVRTLDQIKQELKITAKLRGLTESSLVNLLVVKAIREEKQHSPEAFENSRGAEPSYLVLEKHSPGDEGKHSWKQELLKVKGMWKEREDLPDLETLRGESDRSDRWEKG